MEYPTLKKHNREALKAAKAYAKAKPWRGEFAERVNKLRDFHEALCEAYDLDIDLVVDTDGHYPTQAGGFVTYNSADWSNDDGWVIVLEPGLAVMTYLRLFAEALEIGRDEAFSGCDMAKYAARWANGLFMKAFPNSWQRLVDRDAPILTRDYA